MINFLNKPLFSKHEVELEKSKRRLDLIPIIEKFLNNHLLFKDKNIQVSFPEAGSSSFTCIIESEGAKNVLKIPLNPDSFYKDEGLFLKAWEEVGVKVPHVIEQGSFEGGHYLLMEFVNALPLNKVYKKGAMIREQIYVKMGAILRQMHTAKSIGFGVLKGDKGEYNDFSQWINHWLEYEGDYPNDPKFINEEKHGSLTLATKIMCEYVGTSSESSYCHSDFAYQNIFATDPLTVFDPIPVLSHPYMDLARAIVIAIGRGMHEDASEQLIHGYSGNDLKLDRKVLQAALIIQSYLKFGYWNKVGKEEGIKAVQTYLEKTKNLLA